MTSTTETPKLKKPRTERQMVNEGLPLPMKVTIEEVIENKKYLPNGLRRKYKKALKGRGDLNLKDLKVARILVYKYIDAVGPDIGSQCAQDIALDREIEDNPYLYRALWELESAGRIQAMYYNCPPEIYDEERAAAYRDIFWYPTQTQ